jgi:hypothetical protein
MHGPFRDGRGIAALDFSLMSRVPGIYFNYVRRTEQRGNGGW